MPEAGQLALVSQAPTPVGGVVLHDVIRDFLRSELGQQRLAGLNGVLLDAVAAGMPAAVPLDSDKCHIRDVTFGEDAATGRTGGGPVNLATIRAAVTAAIKKPATTCISPKAAATTPPPPKPSASMASIKTDADIHGTPEPWVAGPEHADPLRAWHGLARSTRQVVAAG